MKTKRTNGTAREQYAQYVSAVASHILTECEAEKYVDRCTREGVMVEYENWREPLDDRGSISKIIDRLAPAHTWREAAETLLNTTLDPDDVDDGLWEGNGIKDWKSIIGVIAHQCFSWDVMEVVLSKFQANDFTKMVVFGRNNPKQLCYDVVLREFTIMNTYAHDLGADVVKVMVGRTPNIELALVFEGNIVRHTYDHDVVKDYRSEKTNHYHIKCTRVYHMRHEDDDIEDELDKSYGYDVEEGNSDPV